MNSSFRLLCVLSLGMAAAVFPVFGQTLTLAAPEVRVAKLNESIPLTADQRVKITEIFKTEVDALAALPSDARPFKRFEIYQAAIGRVRAVLTPAQQKKYDVTPTHLEGGQIYYPESEVTALDRQVGLTEAQKVVAREIFQEQAEALLALSPEDRPVKGREAREAAQEQVRSLLTPEQRKKQTDLRDAADKLMADRRTFLENALRASKSLTARVGDIAALS